MERDPPARALQTFSTLLSLMGGSHLPHRILIRFMEAMRNFFIKSEPNFAKFAISVTHNCQWLQRILKKTIERNSPYWL